MFIPNPGSWFLPSWIPDPKTAAKERGEKNLLSYLFLQQQISHNWTLFYFWNGEEKNLGQFSRIIEFFTQKIVTKLSKIWVWDPGSEIRKKPIPDPGSRGHKSTGTRIRIRNTEKKSRIRLHNPVIRIRRARSASKCHGFATLQTTIR